MKVRNIVRKAAVIGSSGAMFGATMMGALAYDLADYPDQFIADGVFDGKIVVGEAAAAEDIIGAIDIAASLQAASTVEVETPGSGNEVELEGDAFKLSSSNDALELREPVGEVVTVVTERDLAGLKSGQITTSEGTTAFNQYLRLKDGSNLQNMTVNYVENDDDVLADYLVVDTDSPFLEWEIQFPEGFESELDGTDLEDMEDKTFNILGTDFTVVQATLTNGDDVELTLMGGSISDTLREGETRTYSIDGVDYEVTLVFVSDPNSGSVEAKFAVNGETTDALEEGDTDTLSGGLQIGIRDILVNAREGVTSFFLGADKLVLDDTTATTSDTFNGDVEVNNENINDADVSILGQNSSGTTKFEITSIKYRLTMDAADGTTAFIPKGHGVKEFMRRPESLISDTLDLRYEGLTTPETTPFEINAKGDDEYQLTFTNIQGAEYRNIPLLSNKDGTWKFGDDDDEFVFVEAADKATYNIGRNDYFVVSNDRGSGDADKSVTNVLRYEDYDDSDSVLELENLATGGQVNVPIASDGTGSLVVGGHTYAVNVSNVSASEPTINVDLNADGGYGDKVDITVWGGVVVSFEGYQSFDDNTSSFFQTTDFTSPTVVGNGATLENATNFSESGTITSYLVNMSATVLSKNFDTSDASTNGVLKWRLTRASSNEVDLDLGSSDYSGPLEGSVSDVNEFQFVERDDNDDYTEGMTDWGILVSEYNPDGDDPNELTLEVPRTQRLGQVFVTLGSVEARAGGGSRNTQVNPISVGLAVLDRDAPALGEENLILVGGPCANTVAAEFLGNPENCAEGFEPGKGVISAQEFGDTVAILVAGYEAQETLGASRVLAEHEDYALSGSEVEVVVADLNSISVQAPTVSDDTEDDMADESEDMADEDNETAE